MDTILSFDHWLHPFLLEVASLDKPASIKSIIEKIANEHFQLSDEAKARKTKSGKTTAYLDRGYWAKTYLSWANLVKLENRQIKLTKEGKALLAQYPEGLPEPVRKELVERIRQRKQSKDSIQSNVLNANVKTVYQQVVADTPSDSLAESIKLEEERIKQSLLEKLLTMPPVRFEEFCLNLLHKMGYGGKSDGKNWTQTTSASNDGGLDGLLNQDALGLDRIGIQAKRYAAEQSIGRPVLNSFVGSLSGAGLTKGVFLTTAYFSKGAKDYCANLQNYSTVLMDGDAITEAMLRYEVGVTPEQTYTLYKIDTDYEYFDTEYQEL